MLTKFNRRTVATDSGEIIPHATVSFYWQTSGLPATVYADPEGETPLGASVQSDPQGRLGVFMVPGYYRIVVTLGGEILDELTYEPIVNELAVSGSTDFAMHFAEMDAPAATSYMRTLESGFSEWRTPAQVKADLSLDQVNNTSDLQKPISTAVAAALAGKISSTEKGAANGVATLTSAGLIPPTQLPSYVDDVLEYASYAALPVPGESGKIYITANTNQQYRWSGTGYVAMVSSPGSTDAVPEGSTNKYFTEARVRGTVLTGFTVGSNAALASTDTILAALGKVQGQLNGKATSAQGTKADTALQPGANLSALTNDLALINQEAGDARYARRSQNLGDLDSATTARANLGLGTAATANVTTSSTDTTAGRMVKVGDYGNGLALSFVSTGNLNDYKTLGSKFIATSTVSNFVPGWGAAVIEVIGGSTNTTAPPHSTNLRIVQRATQYDTTLGCAYRGFNESTGTWSAWVEAWTTGNLSTTTVGYLSGLTSNVQAQLDAKQPRERAFVTIDGNYTYALVDASRLVKVAFGVTAVTHTIPASSSVDFPIGAELWIQGNTRTISVEPASGVNLFYPDSLTTTPLSSISIGGAALVILRKVNTNVWVVEPSSGYLRSRSNHIGTQAISTVTGLQDALDSKAPATVEQNTRNAGYTLALTDNNKHIYHSNSTAYTWTIPPNSSVAFPIGATVTFVNDGSGNITIAQGSGVTLVLAGTGTTGNRTLAQYGMVTAVKVATDRWYLNGTGVS